MLMLRRHNNFRESVSFSQLARVSNSPGLILSAIELKHNSSHSRGQLLEAVAQCATCCSWANEAWLVIVELVAETNKGIDEDVLGLAEKTGVGILRILSTESRGFKSEIYLSPAYRTQLDLREGFNDTSGQPNAILTAADELIKGFENQNIFENDYGDDVKLIELMDSAIQNLLNQPGFAGESFTAAKKTITSYVVAEARISEPTRKILTLTQQSWPGKRAK